MVAVVRVPEEMRETGIAVGFVAANEKETDGSVEPVAGGVGAEPEGRPCEMGGLGVGTGVVVACLGKIALWADAKRGTARAAARRTFMGATGGVRTVVDVGRRGRGPWWTLRTRRRGGGGGSYKRESLATRAPPGRQRTCHTPQFYF